MRRLALLAAVVALNVAAVVPSQASHSWGNYHWGRTSNPFTLKLVDSVTGVWDGLLSQVSADWTASTALNTTIEPGATGLLEQLLCSAISGKVRACSANYGPNLWFGLATVWTSGGHISQATTQVNDYYFTGSYGNNTARRHVLCQEIGHDLGLDHSYVEPSCMDDTNSTLNTASYVDPGTHDFAQLSTIYAHLDSSSTAASTVTSKRSSVFVRHEGAQTIYTYVFWAA